MVWFATWLGVVLLGIDIGLGVGVISALLVVLAKSSRCVLVKIIVLDGTHGSESAQWP